ncbi:MAG: pyridoxal phosphate-dependent aminotransferase [Candidatus Dormibacteraceae bacterium]
MGPTAAAVGRRRAQVWAPLGVGALGRVAIRLARRMQRLGTEGAFEVLARARGLEAEGRQILHLEIGEPDFPTPDNISEVAIEAIRSGATHYTPAAGLLAAREAVARSVGQRQGREVAADEVVLTPGSKFVVLYALMAVLEPGDEVIVPDPGYPAYASQVSFLGGRPVPVRLREEDGFRLDLEQLAGLIGPRTRALVLNSPHNPTGGVLTGSDLETIAALAMEHDLIVITDEIYSHLLYEGRHQSIMSLPGMAERTVLMDGLSKTYAMCGWRLGYAVAPTLLAEQIERLMINTASCAATFTQIAAIEALGTESSALAVERMVAAFRARRALMVEGLNAMPGVRCASPAGAFYVFPNIEATGRDERDLAEELLVEAGVAVLPGTAFGEAGKGFLRLAYTQREEDLQLALERMGNHLASRR